MSLADGFFTDPLVELTAPRTAGCKEMGWQEWERERKEGGKGRKGRQKTI